MQQQQQQEMDSALYSELEEGERILWAGRPAPGSRNSASPTYVFIILATVFGLIGIAMLLTGFILSGTTSSRASQSASIVMFALGGSFAFTALLMGFFAAIFKQPLRGVLYAITDRRIITFNTGSTRIVTSYGRTDIGSVTRIERQDGTGDLIFAQTRMPGYGYGYGNVNYSYGSYGTGAYGPRAAGAMAGAGRFIGIPNVREVEHLLIRTFKA